MKSHGTSARRSGGSGVRARPISHCFIGLISFSFRATSTAARSESETYKRPAASRKRKVKLAGQGRAV